MRPLSELKFREANALANLTANHLEKNPELRSTNSVKAVVEFFKKSEQKLLAATRRQATKNMPGLPEFGLALYFINSNFPRLATLLNTPPSTVQPKQLKAMTKTVIVDEEGNIWGSGKYEQLDLGWGLSGLYYLATIAGVLGKPKFGTTPAKLKWNEPMLRVGLVGDWGTGSWDDDDDTCPALQIAEHLKAQKPDYTIHLGDVYYAGTDDWLLFSGEETDNFLNVWPMDRNSFALNSNHEMYDAGRGLFNLALKAKPFASQRDTSYFSIETQNWILVGLDTAYFDESAGFHDGAIADSDNAQRSFLGTIGAQNKKVVIFTHHNGMTFDGQARLPLWDQVAGALGRDPDVWYWGHLHTGIVYNSKSASGAKTKSRCCGHSGLPVAEASALLHSGNIEFFAHVPNVGHPPRVLNGFAMLKFDGEKLTEEFYDQQDNLVWHS